MNSSKCAAVVSNNISIRNARTVRHSMLCYVQLCRVMAIGVSTTEAHVPFHVSLCGICGDQVALEQVFNLFSLPLSVLFCQCCIVVGSPVQ
jgi:hypothetical protein